MADTKRSREEQARDEMDRQREREIEEARDRADEAEPPPVERNEDEGTQQAADDQQDSSRACHRRGCNEVAAFVVTERYQEDTGHGAVEAEAALCREHAAEESPSNLDGAYADYVFLVQPVPGRGTPDTA